MDLTIRRIALAAFLGAALLMVCDAALQLSLAAVQVEAYSGTSWWVTARVLERSVWLVAAALLWPAARPLARRLQDDRAIQAAPPMTSRMALRVVGTLMIALPILWLGATLMVFAVKTTLAGSWTNEGRIFLEPYYYSGVIGTNAPWLLAGAAVLAIGGHWSSGEDSSNL
jgi:hypothetical protein